MEGGEILGKRFRYETYFFVVVLVVVCVLGLLAAFVSTHNFHLP